MSLHKTLTALVILAVVAIILMGNAVPADAVVVEGDTTNLTSVAQQLGCQEDEVVVEVVAAVLPDNGQLPGLDWGITEDVGRQACVPLDDLFPRS